MDVVPFLNDQLGVQFAHGLEHPIVIILPWVLEAVERFFDLVKNVPVAWRKLIAEDVENRKVDLVGAVGIRRMDFGLDIGRITKQDIKHIVAFMIVSADDFRVHRDMIGHEGVGDQAFFEPEVFGRIPGIDGVDACLKLLSIAAGMEDAVDIIMPKHRQFSRGITEHIISFSQGFEPNKIIRRGGKRLKTDIRDVSHAAQSHVGAPGHQASDNIAVVCGLFGLAPEHMIERLHEGAVPVDEMQQVANVHLCEAIEKGMINRLATLRVP